MRERSTSTQAPRPELPSARPSFLARLGRSTGQHPLRWVVGWVLAALVSFAVAVGGITGESLFNRLTSGEPRVPGQSQTARDIIESVEPTSEGVMLQVDGAPLDDSRAVAGAAAASAALMEIPGVASVRSPLLSPSGLADPEVRPLLAGGTPESGRFLTIADLDEALTDSELDAARSAVEAHLAEVADALPGATGTVGSYHHVLKAVTGTIERDLVRGEGIALPLTFLVMVFVFGGFVAAGMPIAGAIISIGGALLSLFAFSHALDLDATVVNIVTLLGLGLSIDYGLLTVNRFREELATVAPGRTATREEVVLASERTVATAGRTVLFSGITVAIALSGLLIFEAEIMRAIGLAGVSVVLVAMVVAVTLVPALAVLGAKRLGRKASRAVEDTGVFSRLAVAVQRRPVVVILAGLVVLVAAALPTLDMRLTASGTELLPVTAPQRVFFDTLRSDYPALAAPEVTVVARSADTAAVTAALQPLRAEPGVTDFAVRPLGSEYQLASFRVEGHPTSDEAQDLVTTISDLQPDFETWVTGQASGQIDFLDSMSRRAPYAVGLVVLGTFVLLFLMTGSVVIPAKALLLNVISLGAALGVVVWIFQDGNLEGLLGFTSVGAVESMVPFLVLAFGFGLSMDYEVFLLSRITEEYHAGAQSDRAVSLGLQRTGRIITSAALLIIIVFAGFIAGDILIIKQMGVALVAAVAIDATIVRMLLVPATMTVLGRWNWWAPAGLRRLHHRFGIRE